MPLLDGFWGRTADRQGRVSGEWVAGPTIGMGRRDSDRQSGSQPGECVAALSRGR